MTDTIEPVYVLYAAGEVQAVNRGQHGHPGTRSEQSEESGQTVADRLSQAVWNNWISEAAEPRRVMTGAQSGPSQRLLRYVGQVLEREGRRFRERYGTTTGDTGN